MDLPGSQSSGDARVEALWRKLDPQGKGEIDLKGLQRGLKKIDHPLKNANDMLKDVVKAMDKNGDDVIQYEGRSLDWCEGVLATILLCFVWISIQPLG
jgi:solute carrier family 25 phosphate transporter 23/24/25/41